MLRKILGIVAGVIAWGVVVTLLNMGLRTAWPEYAVIDKAMTFAFTVPMMAARLSESAVSSLVSGYLASLISKERAWTALLTGLVLLAIFAFIHYQIWNKLPLWYHLTFLMSLPVLSLIGGRLRGA
ncbi:MAG: hypothetical protein HY243_00485 [Proteobacteria bacterium]|nr:hypothetical protein [Pseudomonadota bacterium]